VILRLATREDAAAIAVIHRLAAFVPPPHTPDEILSFVRDRLMVENAIWVAEAGGEVVGYIAFNDDWISHLFVHPDHQGQGHGPALLAHAMADGRERQLWTFQSNARARKFYEDRGWVAVELTDGQGNEEKEPDVRYAWPGRLASEGGDAT
jgi:ribosomal protein S18 acetylase RimI-like enzyme